MYVCTYEPYVEEQEPLAGLTQTARSIVQRCEHAGTARRAAGGSAAGRQVAAK